ncbi:MAG TPA: AIR synthase-related protein, partial [Actinomycetota bacterium]|nr:AIR synthase-related protein [Actinomycetota bacterium]
LPPEPPIFKLVQDVGNITDEEMYRVFNMGVGFVVIVKEQDVDSALEVISGTGHRARRIGTCVEGPPRVMIEPVGLIGELVDGESSFRRAT